MIKNIDEVGRIVIPIEIRQRLGIKRNEILRIECIENMIIIQKYQKDKELENLKEVIEVIEIMHEVKND